MDTSPLRKVEDAASKAQHALCGAAKAAKETMHDAAGAATHTMHEAADAAKHTLHDAAGCAKRTFEKAEAEPAKSLLPLSAVVLIVALITYWSISTHGNMQEGLHGMKESAQHAGGKIYSKAHDMEKHAERAMHNTGDSFKRSWETLKHGTEDVAWHAKQDLKEAAHNVKNTVENAAYHTKHGIEHAGHKVRQDTEDVAYDVKHGAEHAAHWMKQRAEDAAYDVKHAGQHAAHDVKNTVENAAWRARQTAENVKHRASEALCTAEDHARGALCAVEDKFHRAAHWFKHALSSHSMPYADRLESHALFKQATVGDATLETKPWAVQVEERAKWEAWNKYNGMPQDEAMARYILHADAMDSNWLDSAVMKSYRKY